MVLFLGPRGPLVLTLISDHVEDDCQDHDDGENRLAQKVYNLVSSLGAFLFSALVELLMRKVGATGYDGEE